MSETLQVSQTLYLEAIEAHTFAVASGVNQLAFLLAAVVALLFAVVVVVWIKR